MSVRRPAMIERFFIWFFGENVAPFVGIPLFILFFAVLVFLFLKYVVKMQIGYYD